MMLMGCEDITLSKQSKMLACWNSSIAELLLTTTERINLAVFLLESSLDFGIHDCRQICSVVLKKYFLYF